MREKYQIEIEKRIENSGSGYAFSAIDFIDIAGTDPTKRHYQGLVNLEQSGGS